VHTAGAQLLTQINADLKKLDDAIESIKKSKRAATAAAAKTNAAKAYKKAQQKWLTLNETRDKAVKAKNNHHLAQSQQHINDALVLSQQTKLAFNEARKNAVKNKLLIEIKADKSRLEALKERLNTAKDKAIAAGAATTAKALFQLATAEEIQAEQYRINAEQQLTQGRVGSAQQALKQAYKQYQSAKRSYEDALNTTKLTQQPMADEFDILQGKLHELSVAYEQKDMPTLQLLSQLSDKQLTLVKRIFDRYTEIDISIKNIRLRKGLATATLVIEQLVKNDGRIIIPADNWKTTALEVKKQADGWSKIQWLPQ